jgi:hypothetical protein
MSISTGLDWTGNLADNADKTAASVDKLVQSLRALQSLQGKSGPTSAGLGGVASGIGGIGAAAKEQNKAVLIQAKSAADLAKIEAQRIANLDVIAAKEKSASAGVAGQQAVLKERGTQAQALEGARAASNVAAIQAQSDADRNRAIGRVIEGQAKAANAISVEQAKGAQAAQRAAEKAALAEQQGAQKSAQIREKSAANLIAIEAKKNADIARAESKRRIDADKAARKAETRAKGKPLPITEATTSGLGGAAKAVLEGKGLKGALGAFGGKGAKIAAVAEVALSVGRAAFDAAKQVAGISFEFGKAIVSAQAYKEDVTQAFKTVRGSTSAADATIKIALQNADRLGITRAESVGQFLDLATKGFDDKKIKEIQGRLYDITTIDPTASIEGLTKVIGKIQATGRLNQETLNELSTFGLEQSDVIKEIGKILGKNDKDVLRMLSSAGGIRGLGVDPVLNAIAAQTGGGEAGAKQIEKANRNLSSLIKRVDEIPQNVLFDLDVGPGIDGIKGILKSILDFFAAGSATAERASKVIGGAFNALISGLTGKDITKDSSGITDLLNNILTMVEAATPALEVFGTVARYAFLAIGAIADGAKQIDQLLGGDMLQIAKTAGTMGSAIIDGLVSGISSGAQSVVDAVKSVASSALNAAKTVLGIASPSKETHALGEWYSIGMGDGIGNQADYVSRAARLMAEDALVAGSMSVPQLGTTQSSTSRNGGALSDKRITIVLPPGPLVQIVAGPGTNAAELLERLEPGIRALFIRIMQQVAQEA